MDFAAKVVLDSVASHGKRLITVVATYPRFIHSEILTHRDRARNSASSRAIPWPKMQEMVQQSPVIPIRWGSEQRGMQAGAEIAPSLQETALKTWMEARDNAIKSAQKLAECGVHKSICNRLTEPFMWITVVMTATEWNNFFRLRCHPDAEIHFQKIAGMIRDAIDESKPRQTGNGEWHLPFVTNNDDLNLDAAGYTYDAVCRISVARCARVSYLTHEGKRDPEKDLELFQRLADGSGFGHYSPFEHVATPGEANHHSGPFVGWKQYRKRFPLENSEG